MQANIEVVAKSSPGRRRDYQEDSYGHPRTPLSISDLQRGVLLTLADGVGGHEAGDIASRIAVDTIEEFCRNHWQPDISHTLCQAISRANSEINLRALNLGKKDMATTVVTCVIKQNVLYLAHVGDSRAYLVRDKAIHQLTKDHSWVQEQIDIGVLTEQMARSHSKRHILSRSLGMQSSVEPELNTYVLEDGDRILLCSDGLYDLIDEDSIKQMLMLEASEACAALVDAANEAGGTDNITVVLAVMAFPFNNNDLETEDRKLVRIGKNDVEALSTSNEYISEDDDEEQTGPRTITPVLSQESSSAEENQLIVDRTLLNRLSTDMLVIKGNLSRILDHLISLEKAVMDDQITTIISPKSPMNSGASTDKNVEILDLLAGQQIQVLRGTIEAEGDHVLSFPPIVLANQHEVQVHATAHLDLYHDGTRHMIRYPWLIDIWAQEDGQDEFPISVGCLAMSHSAFRNKEFSAAALDLAAQVDRSITTFNKPRDMTTISTTSCDIVAIVDEIQFKSANVPEAIGLFYERLELRFVMISR